MSHQTALARNATRLAYVTGAAIILLAILYLAVWADPGVARRNLAPSLPGLDRPDLPRWATTAGFVLGALPLSVLLIGLWQIRRFFQLYRGNDVFPAEAGRYLRNFGMALLVLTPLGIATHTAASILFSMHLPESEREVSINITTTEIFSILIGVLVMMIGHILTEAYRLAEENRQIV